jgi:hypothetical protein
MKPEPIKLDMGTCKFAPNLLWDVGLIVGVERRGMMTVRQQKRGYSTNLASRGARCALAPITLLILLKIPKLRAAAIPWKRELQCLLL